MGNIVIIFLVICINQLIRDGLGIVCGTGRVVFLIDKEQEGGAKLDGGVEECHIVCSLATEKRIQ